MAALITTIHSSRLVNRQHHIHFSFSLSHSSFTPAYISKLPRTRPISATTITCQDTSSSSEPAKSAAVDNGYSPPPPLLDSTSPSSKKPVSPGQGFGSQTPNPASTKKQQQKGGKRGGAKSVIRRNPVEKPVFLTTAKDEVEAKERAQNESAFLVVWLGLGVIIITEGIILAASGFFPDEWDRFFVKYLYPSFTPTVGLFVAGTVVYGVTKYLQNENAKTKQK